MLHILHRATYATSLVTQSPFFMFVMVSSVFCNYMAMLDFFSSSFGGKISDLKSSLRMVLARRKATIGAYSITGTGSRVPGPI